MFDQAQKTLAVTFARALSAREYERAYGMLSSSARSQTTSSGLREDFESMIPPDWGEVEPIALEENPAWDDLLLYVVLGGPVYSEAVIVNGFASEDGSLKIESFQFGRP
jgi:hypothetical protein